MPDERADRGAGQRAAGRRTSDLGVAGPATAPIDSPSSRSFPPTPRCLERNCAYRDPRFLPLGARAPAEGSPRRFPQWTGCTKSVTNLGLPRRIQRPNARGPGAAFEAPRDGSDSLSRVRGVVPGGLPLAGVPTPPKAWNTYVELRQ